MLVLPNGRRTRRDGEQTRAHILNYLREYHTAHQQAPTYAEIAAALGVVRSNVHHHIRILTEVGAVRVTPGPRGVELTQVAAGELP